LILSSNLNPGASKSEKSSSGQVKSFANFCESANKIKTVWFFTSGGGAVDFVKVANVVDVVVVDCGAVVKVVVVLVAVVVVLFVDSVDSVVSLPLHSSSLLQISPLIISVSDFRKLAPLSPLAASLQGSAFRYES